MNSGNLEHGPLGEADAVSTWVSVGALLAAGMLVHPATQAQPAWPVTQFNPKQAAGDVVLPMPCGGSMAFRRVAVPGADALDDRRVQLGNPEARFAYAESSRSDYIGGGFSDAKTKAQRYYLIGKYEVTQLQFDALAATCPKVTEEGRLPKSAITWAEAVGFASQYGAWLVRNAAAQLPSEDGQPGFVRLPTEAEWEFAARGGIAVTDAVFEQPVYPMPEGAGRHLWYAGTDSSNNEVNAIGLLAPNPLGLHDILGNLGEFVLDPFRLNKHSRLHGQAGGYTVKGGDFRTPLADIRAAARTEYLPLDRTGERRDKATGLRLVLVAGALPSPARLQEVRTLWPRLAQTSPTGNQQALADPVKEIEALAKATSDPGTKARIEGIGGVLKANIQSRNEQRDRSAKSEIRVAAYLGKKVLEDRSKIRALEAIVGGPLPENLKAGHRTNLASSREALDGTLDYLMDTLKQLGLDFPAASISAQGEILKREFEARKAPAEYGPLVDLVASSSQAVRGGRPLERNGLTGELARIEQRPRR
jgi:formylglycine-generating enzyme required for sulfatase activity